jgi:hypothetical protein
LKPFSPKYNEKESFSVSEAVVTIR